MKFGIDFGTTYSLASVMIKGKAYPLVRPIFYGDYAIPSLFAYHPRYGEKTGLAVMQNSFGLSQIVREIKMDLKSSPTLVYEWQGREGSKTFTSRHIVSAILEEVIQTGLQQARQYTNEPLEGVFISVPAKFKHNERETILEAAKMSVERISEKNGGGRYRALGLIREPVAAALYYFQDSLTDQTRILVYDLGGGTCDVAIVEADSARRERYKVIAADMRRIGGTNWDSRLEQYIVGELKRAQNWDRKMERYIVERLEEMRQKSKGKSSGGKDKGKNGGNKEWNLDWEKKIVEIRQKAVELKVKLSDYDRPDFVTTDFPNDNGGNDWVDLRRETFLDLTKDLLQETVDMTKELLRRNAGAPVTELICVGGSSNMWEVREALHAALPKMEIKVFEPEYAVAKGAAIYAAQAPELLDIAPYSYGVRAAQKDNDSIAVYNLIHMDDSLPAIGKYTFTTSRANQSQAGFPVYESEVARDVYAYAFDEETPILEVVLDLPSGNPAHMPVDVTLTLTQDSILEVVADDRKGHIMKGHKELIF